MQSATPAVANKPTDTVLIAASAAGTVPSDAVANVDAEKQPVKRRVRKKKAAEAVAEPPEPTCHAEPLPPVDLAANVPTGQHWDDVRQWVVFSDLHVSVKTVEVACQVLQRVREEAAARNAGVLFLGAPCKFLLASCQHCHPGQASEAVQRALKLPNCLQAISGMSGAPSQWAR